LTGFLFHCYSLPNYEFASDQVGFGPHQSLPERAIAVAGLLPVVGWLGHGVELERVEAFGRVTP